MRTAERNPTVSKCTSQTTAQRIQYSTGSSQQLIPSSYRISAADNRTPQKRQLGIVRSAASTKPFRASSSSNQIHVATLAARHLRLMKTRDNQYTYSFRTKCMSIDVFLTPNFHSLSMIKDVASAEEKRVARCTTPQSEGPQHR